MKAYPSLQTNRVYLRILERSDTEEVFRHFTDPDITEFMDIEPCKSVKEAEEIITYHLEDTGCRWGLFDKLDGALLGTCGFHYIRKTTDNHLAEIGFDLAKSHWGKGIMREVLDIVITYGFTNMGYTTIDATVDPCNERSIRLMEHVGFTRNKELQDNLVYFHLSHEDWRENR